MAPKSRRPTPPLIEELRNRPYRFDFYQAVRLVELLRGIKIDPEADGVPVGEGPDPRKEAVRFSSDPSLAFPPSAIKSYAPSEGTSKPDRMTIHFLGLAGAMGPLPRSFTERLIRRVAAKDTAWRDFLDLFNHRLASLMVRVRKAHRIGLDTRPPQETLIARFLRAFLGLGTPGLSDRMAIDDRTLLRYAGLFTHRPRTAMGLQQILRDHYQMPCEVRQFCGEWVDLEPGQESRIGLRLGGNQALGTEATLGTRYWDQQAGIELVIGPLDRASFESFLPGGSRHRPLMALVMFYISPEFNISARLIAAPEAVPEARLGGDLRLGWTSWLGSQPLEKPDDQVRIRVRDNRFLHAT